MIATYNALRNALVGAVETAWGPIRVRTQAAEIADGDGAVPLAQVLLSEVKYEPETPTADAGHWAWEIRGLWPREDLNADAVALDRAHALREALLAMPGVVLPHVPTMELHPRRGDARDSRTGVTVHFRCRVTAPRPPMNEVNEQ